MAEVGTKTGSKTQAGRDVYKTPEGEMVSEKSTTFEYKGKWINVPTIHKGYSYDEDVLRMMLDAEVIKPTSVHTNKKDAIKAARERSKNLKFNEGGDVASQTEEALGWTAEGKKFADENPVEVTEEKPAALSIADVPVFDRPMDASESDRWTGVQDELGNRQYKTIFGRTYFVRPADDQRTNYEKIQQDIIPAVRNYLDNPTAPSREQTINFLKESLGAAWETFKIPGDLAAGNKGMGDVTLGNIFELAGGTGAASTVVKVPDGDLSNTTRIFGGPGAASYKNRALEKAMELKKAGYSPAEIEAATGRVETGSPESYVDTGPSADNIFKFEIDDSAIKIKSDDGFQLLTEATRQHPIVIKNIIPDHKELFWEYPNLDFVEFHVDPALGTGAHFDHTKGRNGAIVVGSKQPGLKNPNSEVFRTTFFHELQHAAQFLDFKETGLLQLGGSPTYFGKLLVRGGAKDKVANINKRAEKLKDELLEIYRAGSLDDPKVTKKLARKMRELDHEFFKTYMRTASETEARLAGRRAGKLVTVGDNPNPEITMDLDQERKIETLKEYHKKKPNLSSVKKLDDAIIKLGPMTEKEVSRYSQGAINFARYAEGLDSELKGFGPFGPKYTQVQPQTKVKRYRDDLDPVVYDAFDELAEIQRGAPEIAMTSAQKALEGGVLSYALEHTGDLTHRMAEKGGVYGSEYVKPKVNRLLDSLLSEYGFEKEHLENLKNTAQFNYDKLGKNTDLSFEQYYQDYVDNAQEKIKTYAEEHKKVPVYNDMQLAGREAAIAIGEGRYTDAVEHLYLIKSAIDDGTYRQKSVEFNPEIDFRKEPDQGFAQGGVVNDMNRQMKMFAVGGIADDGLSRDPVSGNEIPPGSLAEEVRDDIPAQLSEGEYVVPADVVRFFGVKFFEDLRTEAKMGLSNMEANGRIGGEPVAMPMAQASNPNEITEEDLAQLEQMLSTGVANGGLMDKIAIAAKTDKVINDRMNANGMVVGYAAGGEVTAPTASYADPTRVDAVINKVMATLQQKPELIQELSKRGIQISRTNPSMEAGQMNQANPPAETRKAFALGGMPDVPGYGVDTSYVTPTGLPSWAAVPGSSYTYQGPGVPPAPGTIPAATTEPAVAAPSSTEESCKAMGMGYDPVTQTCILVDSGDSGSVTTPEPAEFKWEEPDVNYFEMSEEELSAIGTGAKIDPFLNKLALGAAVVSGPLGLLVGGYNAYQQGKAISEVRAAALVAKARGFDDLADTLSKQADDLVSKSSFLVQGANTFGGLSGSNDFFQQVAAFSPENFKLDKDAFKGKPELQKRYVEAVGKAMETRYDKQQSASNFGVTTAEEQRAILSDPAKLKEARDKAAAYKAEMAKKEATTVTTSAPWVSSSNEDGNTAHEDMMKAVASKKTTDPSGQSVTETTYSTPGGGSFTVGADEDGLYKGGLMKKRKKKK